MRLNIGLTNVIVYLKLSYMEMNNNLRKWIYIIFFYSFSGLGFHATFIQHVFAKPSNISIENKRNVTTFSFSFFEVVQQKLRL
jgi:hypothetical protein